MITPYAALPNLSAGRTAAAFFFLLYVASEKSKTASAILFGTGDNALID